MEGRSDVLKGIRFFGGGRQTTVTTTVTSIVTSTLTTTSTSVAAGAWTPTGSMNAARAFPGVAVLSDGKVVRGGGTRTDDSPVFEGLPLQPVAEGKIMVFSP